MKNFYIDICQFIWHSKKKNLIFAIRNEDNKKIEKHLLLLMA